MVHLSWKQCLLVANIATVLVGVVVAVQVDNACFFWSDPPECSQHRLQCGRGTVFLTQAVRGFKSEYHPCRTGNTNCVNKTTCCHNDTGQDCLETYTQAAFSDLARECWNRQACNHSVQQAQRTSCKWPSTLSSGYSEVQYVCLDDSAIHDFSDSNPMTASSLALRHLSSHGAGSYVCRVTAEDFTGRTASVLLTKWPNTTYQYCSSLKVTGDDWLPCSTSVSYKTYTRTTPFDVWLYVVNDKDIAQAWAVINADDSSKLRVECKPWTIDVSFQNCTPATMAPTSPRLTSQRTESTALPPGTTAAVLSSVTAPTTAPTTPGPTSQRTDSTPPSASTGTSGTTAAVLSSVTPSLASSPGSDVTTGTMSQSAENTGNTAAVVGGVVGAVVVVLLVVALVVTVFFVRRRSPTTNPFTKAVAWFKGGNSSRSHGNLGRAEPHVTYAQPTSLPVYDNSAVAIADEAGVRDPDSDYNHLGQKPASSAFRDVTYGHLADGNDVNDYGYDHVTKGKPAARSGDVINNVYNTPGLATGGPSDEDFYHTTGAAKIGPDVINNVYNTAGPATAGSSDEDFYNTTGEAKNRPDVINNVYNTPSPAIEASCDVEYYNTADVTQLGRDVTNTVYDTPKSARTAGPGQTEARDVKGAVADSPYELARNVK